VILQFRDNGKKELDFRVAGYHMERRCFLVVFPDIPGFDANPVTNSYPYGAINR